MWADLGRQEDAGVWLVSAEQVCSARACVCALWCKGTASQQNVETSTDTTQIEKNNFDKGLQMITALESFKKQHLHSSGYVSYITQTR